MADNRYVHIIVTLLNKTDMTVIEFAAKIGVDASTVFMWAKGRQSPSVLNCEAAFNVLGYNLVHLPMELPNDTDPIQIQESPQQDRTAQH